MIGERVSVVIPAFNEAGRIRSSLAALDAFCRARFADYEIVCVDDGSRDATARCVRSAGLPTVRLVRLARNRGKGGAVKAGMLAAAGTYRLFTDADLPYRLEALGRAVALLRAGGCDLVAGERTLPGCRPGRREPLLRRTASAVFRRAVHCFTRIDVHDSQCGLKGFSAAAALSLFAPLKSTGYAFDVELLQRARVQGLRVGRLPVHLVRGGPSSIRLCRHSVAMTADLARIAWRRGRAEGSGGLGRVADPVG